MVFLSAFRAGRQQLRSMLILGVMYGAGLWLIIGATSLVDGGKFASGYIAGTTSPIDIARDTELWSGMFTFLALQLPLSLMFWHAPALVHWYKVPPLKSLFFSLVACLRNFWAFTLFGLAWMAITMLLIVCITLVAGVMGNAQIAGVALVPGTLMIAAMIFTSTYFSFRDCFMAEAETLATQTPPSEP